MTRQIPTHIDDPASFGKRLRDARTRAGLRMADLEFPGCSISYLSHLESGKRIPSLQVVRALAQRLLVAESWLALGVDAVASVVSQDHALTEAEAALRFEDFETAERLYREALELAGENGERARAHAGLAQLALLCGDPRQSICEFEAALELDRSLVDDPAVSEAFGRAYARVGEMEMALSIFQARLDAALATGDAICQTRFAVLVANTLIDMSRLGAAAQVLANVISMGSADHDPVALARVHWSQSRLHAMRQDNEAAIRYARKALDVFEATDHLQHRARAHHLLAYIQVDAGQPEEALDVIERGRQLAGCGGVRFDLALFDIEEARARAQLGEVDRAASLAMRASQELAHHHPIDVGRCFGEIAAICDREGDSARARELYELAIEYLESQRPNPILSQTLTRYADLLEREGDREGAFAAYKRAAMGAGELDRLGVR